MSGTDEDLIVCEDSRAGESPTEERPLKRKRSSRKSVDTNEEALMKYVKDFVPEIKKEYMKKEKEAFSKDDLDKYSAIFRASSVVRPAYCLPLFHFCHSVDLYCTKVGLITKQAKVYTEDGVKRLESFEKLVSGEEYAALYSKFRWCWQKIPHDYLQVAKEALERSTAKPKSMRMRLVGIKEETFPDSVTGKAITIARPLLEFDPCF